MNHKRTQRGMSIVTVLFILILVAFLGLVGLKLLPVYLESFKVGHALSGVLQDPNVSKQTSKEMAWGIVRRLDIDGSDLISASNWKDYMKVKKESGKVTITITWRKEVPLFGNLSMVADFEKVGSNRP